MFEVDMSVKYYLRVATLSIMKRCACNKLQIRCRGVISYILETTNQIQ